jgi:hypothetical protein
MNKLFSRIIMTGIVAAGAMFAASFEEITVTLPHAVTVGSTTLQTGTYTLSPMEMSDGGEYFIVRGANTSPVVIPVQKSESLAAAKKTELTLSDTTTGWHLDKLTIQGETTSYELGEK